MDLTRRQFHLVSGLAPWVAASGYGMSPCAAAEGDLAPRRRGCPLQPSILVFHKPHHDNGVAQVVRAARLGFRRVHVVVSLFCETDASRRVLAYGQVVKDEFRPLSEAGRREFVDHLRGVFSAVRDARLELAVTAHLNDWGTRDTWRNLIDFDPRASYGNYSYEEAVVESIVEAHFRARGAASWELSLIGEMGRTLFTYPEAYLAIMERLRKDERASRCALGVSLNFGDVTGEVEPKPEQRPQIQALFATSDFLGLSNYRPFELPVTREDFGEAVSAFLSQLDREGVTAHRNLPLVFTEVGLGGCQQNNVPASSPAAAARTPWVGTVSPQHNPWDIPSLRTLRREFHKGLLEFLASPPEGVALRGAYLWSEGSWDPLDIVDRGFFDAEIVRELGRHNRQCEG